jgi:hypothetical protein
VLYGWCEEKTQACPSEEVLTSLFIIFLQHSQSPRLQPLS